MKIKQSLQGNTLTTTLGKSTFTQELSKKTVYKGIPGIRYETCTVGSYRYLSVIHVQSGIPIRNYTSAPVRSVRVLMAHLNGVLSAVDWDLPEDGVRTKAHEKVAQNLGVTYDEKLGYYTF